MLTDISRGYCGEEFLMDTPHLLSQIDQLNARPGNRKKALLFTLDVTALYPSIKPDLALKAMQDAFARDRQYSIGEKEALTEFTNVILDNSFVTFEDAVYQSLEGIPTGNCISRQITDFFMHWLLFRNLVPRLSSWNRVALWFRFIDDVLGRWYGTERQFKLFVEQLNELAAEFGITFGEYQIGGEVNFLDVTLYLDNNGLIQYRLYTKETDARLYLNPSSFHPQHVFQSVVFSQMIRVIGRNSLPETCSTDLEELKRALIGSGHSNKVVEEKESSAYERAMQLKQGLAADSERDSGKAVVLAFDFFKDADTLRRFIKKLEPDIRELCGEDTSTLCAMRRHQTIGNLVVKNRRLSGGSTEESVADTTEVPDRAKCGSARCKTCPLMMEEQSIKVGEVELELDRTLGCKSNNVVYIAICQHCPLKKAIYVGQTTQKFRDRVSGHRGKFKVDDVDSGIKDVYKGSALSFHCYLEHPDRFSLSGFRLGLIKSVPPKCLDREENVFINKLRANVLGLNRIDVVR